MQAGQEMIERAPSHETRRARASAEATDALWSPLAERDQEERRQKGGTP